MIINTELNIMDCGHLSLLQALISLQFFTPHAVNYCNVKIVILKLPNLWTIM